MIIVVSFLTIQPRSIIGGGGGNMTVAAIAIAPPAELFETATMAAEGAISDDAEEAESLPGITTTILPAVRDIVNETLGTGRKDLGRISKLNWINYFCALHASMLF